MDSCEEMDRLIGRIERHQQDLGLNDSRFCTRYARFIGSQKTWVDRLRPRNWRELSPKWLPKLREFVRELDGVATDIEIDHFPIVQHAVYLFDKLAREKTDRRCATLIGRQGTGKTLALRHVLRENPGACAFLSANETWKDSRMRIAAALAGAVGAPVTASASATFAGVLSALQSNPITLLIDEAHEGGVLLMKLVKTIINDTNARVLLAQYPTSWHRLNNGANDAYAEAQQLLRRTQRPVRMDWAGGITRRDALAFLKARGLDAAGLLDELLPLIQAHGNYSLMADAYARAKLLADEDDAEVTPAAWREEVRCVCGLPKEKREAA